MDTVIENSWPLIAELPPAIAILVLVLLAMLVGGAYITRRAMRELFDRLIEVTHAAHERQEHIAVALMAIEARLASVEFAIRTCPVSAGYQADRGHE